MWGDMGLFSLAFLDQNLFISSLAVVPIGAALQWKKKKDVNKRLLTNFHTTYFKQRNLDSSAFNHE